MDEDGPNDSPYEMLAKHDQSETKCDRQGRVPHAGAVEPEARGRGHGARLEHARGQGLQDTRGLAFFMCVFAPALPFAGREREMGGGGH
jgi:hypothetical protein